MNDIYDIAKNSELFRAEDDSKKLNDLDVLFTKRKKLVPVGGPINVWGQFDWKNRGVGIEEVPVLVLQEHTLSMGGIAASLINIFKQVSEVGSNILSDPTYKGVVDALSDPYASMYVVDDSGPNASFVYYLPWLLSNGSTIRDISNNWQDATGNSAKSSSNSSDPSLIEKGLGFLAGAAGAAISPGWGMEPIFSYQGTDRYAVTIKFPLYNTFDIQSTRRNFDFVNLITYQNLKNRTSLVSYVPPSVYTVSSDAYGGFYMPLAYVENLKIESIGTVRRLDGIISGQNLLIPEAYSVTIRLRELLPQSSNIFAGAMGGKKIEVTSTLSQVANIFQGNSPAPGVGQQSSAPATN
jgi:hypothetical protein